MQTKLAWLIASLAVAVVVLASALGQMSVRSNGVAAASPTTEVPNRSSSIEPTATSTPDTGAVSVANRPPETETTSKEIPARFIGKWDKNVAQCGSGLNDSALQIAGHRLDFYESEGPVVSVVRKGPNEIVVHAALTGEGEGPWDAKIHFKISKDGNRLTDETAGSFTRFRCRP
jgi:hypothetical protein